MINSTPAAASAAAPQPQARRSTAASPVRRCGPIVHRSFRMLSLPGSSDHIRSHGHLSGDQGHRADHGVAEHEEPPEADPQTRSVDGSIQHGLVISGQRPAGAVYCITAAGNHTACTDSRCVGHGNGAGRSRSPLIRKKANKKRKSAWAGTSNTICRPVIRTRAPRAGRHQPYQK